jgi:hypothetical protein
MTERTQAVRATAVTVFAAYVGFIVAGLGYQKLTEYDDFMSAAARYPLVGAGFHAVQAGSVVALLAVLLGGLPLAWAALHDALARRRYGILALFAVPVIAFAALFGYGFAAVHIKALSGQSGQATGGLIAVLMLGAAASAWAVSLVILRSEVPARFFRFALAPALVATGAMALMLVAAVVWGVALRASDPALFGGNDGIHGTSTALSWGVQVAVMALCMLAALVGVWRGLPPRSASVARAGGV